MCRVNVLKMLFCCLSMAILFSCGSNERTKFNTIKDIVIVKQVVLKPFAGYEIVDNKLHLIGPSDGNIPRGFWELDYSGECDLGRFAVIYQKTMDRKAPFDYKFGFHDLYHIEITDVNEVRHTYSLENNPDSVRTIYDYINKVTKNNKNTIITFHYKIGLLCFDRLESPEKQAGFNGHLTQQIGGDNPKILQYPYIRLHPELFSDMKKKGFLTKKDRFYVNSGSGTGYKYKTIDDILY